MSWDWEVSEEDFEFDFPHERGEQLTFMEFLWRETKSQINRLPEISYEEIPELLE